MSASPRSASRSDITPPGPRSAPGRWRHRARLALGVLLTLLGLLWVLQGADLIRIDPILCAANCRPIAGGSPGWFAAGVLTLIAGLALLGLFRRRRG